MHEHPPGPSPTSERAEMTRKTKTYRCQLGRAAASLMIATMTLSLAVDAGRVHAGTNTSSAAIASDADTALGALATWQRTGAAADKAKFDTARDTVAARVAADVDSSAERLRTAWAQAAVVNQQVMLAALTQLGVPYRSLASEEGVGFDCSGLMLYAFREAGIELPRISGDQIDAATAVDAAVAEPGDFVFYPGHISLYIGDGLMVHSPNSGNVVEVRAIPERSLRYGDITESRSNSKAPRKSVGDLR